MTQEHNGGFSYIFKNGQAYWLTPYEREGKEIGNKIAVLYDYSTGVLLRHGTTVLVQERFEEMRSAYLALGWTESKRMAKDLVIVELEIRSEEDLEPINQMIAHSGSCNRILRHLFKVNA